MQVQGHMNNLNGLTNLWIEGMKALLGHIKGITSGTHSAPEKI